MSEREEPLDEELTVIGTSGTIDDVLGSEEIDIYSFHTARAEPHVSKLQK